LGDIAPYSGTCHVTFTPLDLGSAPALPNLSFELNGFEYGTAGRSSSSTHVCRLPCTISGSRSASLEPDTNSKIYFTLSPEPRVRWDRRGILANPISGTAVLEYGPAEILPPVGAISKLGLTRFGGHPESLARGAADAKNTSTVFAGVRWEVFVDDPPSAPQSKC
jgi:hypothetical protein